MAKSHKTCIEQSEIIDTFGTYQGGEPEEERKGGAGRRTWVVARRLAGCSPEWPRRLVRRRWRNREGFAKKGSPLGGSTPRGKYRRRGASRRPTGQPGGHLARPRVGPHQAPSWIPGGGPPSLFWFFHQVPSRWFLI